MCSQTRRWVKYRYKIIEASMIVQVSLLWIPYIIFRNTDSDEAVAVDSTRTVISITRQGDFVRSGPEIADEVATSDRMHKCNTLTLD